MKKLNNTQKQNQEENKKKRRALLLGLLIPLGTIAVATAITLPIVLNKDKGQTKDVVVIDQESTDKASVSDVKRDSNNNLTFKVNSKDTTKLVFEVTIKINDYTLTSKDYTLDTTNGQILIKKEILTTHNGNVVVKPTFFVNKEFDLILELDEDTYSVGDVIKPTELNVYGVTLGKKGETQLVYGTDYKVYNDDDTEIANFDTVGYTVTNDDKTAGTKNFKVKHITQTQLVKEAIINIDNFSDDGIVYYYTEDDMGNKIGTAGRNKDAEFTNQYLKIKPYYVFDGEEIPIQTIQYDGNDGNTNFHDCLSLKEVKLPYTMKNLLANTSIDEPGTFQGCKNLQKITFQNTKNHPSRLTNLFSPNFIDCESLKEIFIPAGCDTFGINEFKGCKSLEKVEFEDTDERPSNFRHIHKGCFDGCTSLKTITLPKSVEGIQENSFKNSGLTSVIFNAPETWRIAHIVGSEYEYDVEKYDVLTSPEKNAFNLTHTTAENGYMDCKWNVNSTIIQLESDWTPYYLKLIELIFDNTDYTCYVKDFNYVATIEIYGKQYIPLTISNNEFIPETISMTVDGEPYTKFEVQEGNNKIYIESFLEDPFEVKHNFTVNFKVLNKAKNCNIVFGATE